MPVSETVPVIMKSETKNGVENLIHNLLFNVAAHNGEDLRNYDHLLGKTSDLTRIHSKFYDDPMGRLRSALQVYEENYIDKDDGMAPPVTAALEKIIRACNKLEGPLSAEETDAIQGLIASGWEQVAAATGNWKIAQRHGFDTTVWSD